MNDFQVPCYILKTPNCVLTGGLLKDALRDRPSTERVSMGSITPSSHSLGGGVKHIIGDTKWVIKGSIDKPKTADSEV